MRARLPAASGEEEVVAVEAAVLLSDSVLVGASVTSAGVDVVLVTEGAVVLDENWLA